MASSGRSHDETDHHGPGRRGARGQRGVCADAAPSGGAADSNIGDEVDATFTVPLTPTITIGGGIGHMFPGAFLKANTAGASDTFTFLFTNFKL